jgi:hypothetical protein
VWGTRKRALTAKQALYVTDLTKTFLDRLLEFKLQSDVTDYIIKTTLANGGLVKYDADLTFPVKAQGIIFRRSGQSPLGPLVDQQIGPETALEYLGGFPLEAAAINYVFTILEIYGDLIVRKTNAKFFKNKNRRQNWHHRLHGDARTEIHEVQIKMANCFGEPFLVAGANVDSGAVLKLIELKRARNAFAHGADAQHRFDVLFGYAVDVIREIYFLLRQDQEILAATPFNEDSEPFEDARQEQEIIDNENFDDECASSPNFVSCVVRATSSRAAF